MENKGQQFINKTMSSIALQAAAAGIIISAAAVGKAKIRFEGVVIAGLALYAIGLAMRPQTPKNN